MRRLLEKYGLISVVVLIFLFAGYRRVILFPLLGSGGDSREYISAAQDFIEGTNPYIATVESFKHLDDDPGGKGFSYLPGLLYINSFENEKYN